MRRIQKPAFEIAPEGTHLARITVVADLGMQLTTYQGQQRVGPRLGISFELATEKSKAGRPLAVFDIVSSSLHEKSRLSEIARAALGQTCEDLDPGDLLGRPVMVSIVHKVTGDRTYANVSQVTAVPRGLTVPETETPLLAFDLAAPDAETFRRLPALFRKRIEERVAETEKAELADPALEENIPY